MTEHTPTTDEVRHMFATAQLGGAQPALPVPALMREFDRWLDQVKADAWDEGFDAGERDVFEHEHTSFDAPCIRNPYRKEAAR